MCERVPFFFPIGLRTASTINASDSIVEDCTAVDAAQEREDRALEAGTAVCAVLARRAGADRPALHRAQPSRRPDADEGRRAREGVHRARRGPSRGAAEGATD